MSERTDFCRTCGARIVWIKTLAGKQMPCDAALQIVVADAESKSFYIHPTGRVFHARPAGPSDTNATREIAHISHFATCPQAAQHRRST